MKSHEERVLHEQNELEEKIDKLALFCYGENNSIFQSLHPIDQRLLEKQHAAMLEYLEILERRIARFGH